MNKLTFFIAGCITLGSFVAQKASNPVINAILKQFQETRKLPHGWRIDKNIITSPGGISWTIKNEKKPEIQSHNNFMLQVIKKQFQETGIVPNGWHIDGNVIIDPKGKSWPI